MKISGKKLALLALSATIAATSFAAEDADNAQKASATSSSATKVKMSDTTDKLNPWTDCGIGAMLFDETKWAAVTSNVIWDWGLTATTSAVSSKHVCEGKLVAAAFFIDTTYANLEEETVSGKVEHTTALLNILGCDGSAHNAATSAIRDGFSAMVSTDDYAAATQSEKAQQYYFMVDNVITSQFASQCDKATI